MRDATKFYYLTTSGEKSAVIKPEDCREYDRVRQAMMVRGRARGLGGIEGREGGREGE